MELSRDFEEVPGRSFQLWWNFSTKTERMQGTFVGQAIPARAARRTPSVGCHQHPCRTVSSHLIAVVRREEVGMKRGG